MLVLSRWSRGRHLAAVNRTIQTLLLAGSAAFALSACATMQGPEAPPPSTTQAGKYLAAHFAASKSDLNSASNYYSETLSDDPMNGDLRGRAFLYAAEGGDITARAAALVDGVIADDPENRPAHLVRAAHALMTKDYASVAADSTGPGGGALGNC